MSKRNMNRQVKMPAWPVHAEGAVSGLTTNPDSLTCMQARRATRVCAH